MVTAQCTDGTSVAAEILEIEFIEKKLKCPKTQKRKLFLVTDDCEKQIYEILDNGEPGECIGKLTGKNNKPYFF